MEISPESSAPANKIKTARLLRHLVGSNYVVLTSEALIAHKLWADSLGRWEAVSLDSTQTVLVSFLVLIVIGVIL